MTVSPVLGPRLLPPIMAVSQQNMGAKIGTLLRNSAKPQGFYTNLLTVFYGEFGRGPNGGL